VMDASPGRTRDHRIAQEQAALRRVAVLVAGGTPPEEVFSTGGAPPEEVFAAVAEEVGRLLGTVQTNMLRYDPDDLATIVAVHGRVGDAAAVSVGDRYKLGGRNATTLVFETGRPARIDGYSGAWGAVGRAAGYGSSVGVPISVEGRLWGVIGRPGSMTMAPPWARLPTSPATGSTARRLACRSAWKVGSGAS